MRKFLLAGLCFCLLGCAASPEREAAQQKYRVCQDSCPIKVASCEARCDGTSQDPGKCYLSCQKVGHICLKTCAKIANGTYDDIKY
jgi:hypothetical protein